MDLTSRATTGMLFKKRSSLVIPLASKVFWVCNMEVGGGGGGGGMEEWGGERKGRGGGGGGVSIKIKGSF